MNIKKDLEPVKWILTYVTDTDTYPKHATDIEWQTLVDLHYQYVKENRGNKECVNCRKVFTVCRQLTNKLNEYNKAQTESNKERAVDTPKPKRKRKRINNKKPKN